MSWTNIVVSYVVSHQFFHMVNQDEFSKSQTSCHSSICWSTFLHSIWNPSCTSPCLVLRFFPCLSQVGFHGTQPYVNPTHSFPNVTSSQRFSMTFQTSSLFCWHKWIYSQRLISLIDFLILEAQISVFQEPFFFDTTTLLTPNMWIFFSPHINLVTTSPEMNWVSYNSIKFWH